MTQLYVIREENGCCKIGISEDSLRRIRGMQTDNHSRLELVFSVEFETLSQAVIVESSLHRLLSHYKKQGEWFLLRDAQIVAIRDLFEALNLPTNGIISNSPKPSLKAMRAGDASNKAYQWLLDNPEARNKPVRELAEIIGVGKDSIAKAKKKLNEEGAES